jgi:hypothetical protein
MPRRHPYGPLRRNSRSFIIKREEPLFWRVRDGLWLVREMCDDFVNKPPDIADMVYGSEQHRKEVNAMYHYYISYYKPKGGVILLEEQQQREKEKKKKYTFLEIPWPMWPTLEKELFEETSSNAMLYKQAFFLMHQMAQALKSVHDLYQLKQSQDLGPVPIQQDVWYYLLNAIDAESQHDLPELPRLCAHLDGIVQELYALLEHIHL